MKVIYDTDKPYEKRIEFKGRDGKSYFGFHCFQILLDDGNEVVKINNWGNKKERNKILDFFNGGRK